MDAKVVMEYDRQMCEQTEDEKGVDVNVKWKT